GGSHRVLARRPEAGVAEVKLNLYLAAPEAVRVGGGSLRQLVLPLANPAGSVEYAVTGWSAGRQGLTLAVYQGSFYLGRLPVEAEFALPPSPAARPAPARKA